MSKISYTLNNLTANDVHIGSVGVIPPYQTRSFTVEDGSADDTAVATAVSGRFVSIASSTSLVVNPTSKRRPVNGRTVIAQIGTPTIYVSSGSSNATGQITLTTALSYQPTGPAAIRLPAGVVVGDATGGVYSVTFSSTSVCQIVGSPVTANAAFTQTTATTVTIATVVVPAGIMGTNSSLQVRSRWSALNNANVKTVGLQFGSGVALSGAITSNATGSLIAEISNRGATNIQNITPTTIATQYGLSTAAVIAQGTTDTTANVNLIFTVNNAVATDYVFLEGLTVELVDAA